MFSRTLIALLLAGVALAQPAPKKVAMVLKAEGSPEVLTGQMWSDGQSIDLPAGSRVTVLLLNKGERLELSGKGKVQVSTRGLSLKGVQSKSLASTQVRLALNGENQRQIGGMTLRRVASKPWDSSLDRVEVTPEGLTLSRPDGKGAPPPLKFVYLDQETMPTLLSNFETVAESGRPAKSVFATQVSGHEVGGRWQWQAPWPLEDTPKAYSLRVFDPSSQKLSLWTRLYHASAQEETELAAARKQVAQWSQLEPKSPQPWVYLANLLEEKGFLEEALAATDSALSLRPGDPGVLNTKARLLLDLGRYSQASQLKVR